jgi:arylsulfatase
MLPAAVGPRVLNRPHSITADVSIPAAGAEGVLLCQGANTGGFAFYVKDQRLHYAHNYLSRAVYQVSTPDPLPEGNHRLRFEFEPTGEPDFPNGRGAPGRAQLYVDDQLVAQTDIPVTVPIAFNPGGLSCGSNPGAPIVTDYRSPFRFTGTLHQVTVDVSGELIIDSEAEMRMAMSRQ